jgi:voltage-gated sodium channel
MEVDPGEKPDSDSEKSEHEEESKDEEDETLVVLNEYNDYRKHRGLTRQYLLVTYYSLVATHSKAFNYLILLVIIIAGVNVGVQTYPSMATNPILTILDEVILIMFSIECILKILAEGLKPWVYWTGKEWKWNNFDFTIVFMSLPFWHGLFGSGSLALLRLIRLMRLGKLIKKIPALQMIVQGLLGGLKSIGYILILLFLVYYLFSVVGFYLFSENDPFNFGDIPMAMISLFRCSTLDAWSDIMYVNIYGCK